MIPLAERKANGYQIFTDFHIEQLRLARIAFQIEVLQNGLRKKVVETIKFSAKREFDKAFMFAEEYRSQIQREQRNAEESIGIAKQILSGKSVEHTLFLKRKEVSDYLDISMDTLRNWERNGLIQVKRKTNGYRTYTSDDIVSVCGRLIVSLKDAEKNAEKMINIILEMKEKFS